VEKEPIYVNNRGQADEIDVKRLLVRYARNWIWVLLSIGVFATLAYLYIRYNPNIYRVRASVLVEDNSNLSDPSSLLFEEGLIRSKEKVANEASIIGSYPIMRETVEILDFQVSYYNVRRVLVPEIYNQCPFIVTLDTLGTIDEMDLLPFDIPFDVAIHGHQTFSLSLNAEEYENLWFDKEFNFNEPITIGDFAFSIQLRDYYKGDQVGVLEGVQYQFVVRDLHQLALEYRNRLSVSPQNKESSILELTMESPIPSKAIDFLEGLTENYIRHNLAEKNRIADNTIRFIDRELALISDSLQRVEVDLEVFKSASKINDISSVGESLLREYTMLESDLAREGLKLKYYAHIRQKLTGDKDFENLVSPTAFGVNDPLLESLVLDLIRLQLQNKSLLKNGGIENPIVKMNNGRIEDLLSTVLSSVDDLSKSSDILVLDVEKRLKEIDRSARMLPGSERELVTIQRMLDLSEKTYIFLSEKRAEAAIAKSSNIPDIKIVESAMLQSTSPISPVKKMIYLGAFLIALVFPMVLLIIQEYFNDKVRGKEDLLSLSQIPFLGIIPTSVSKEVAPVSKKPKSSVAESFRILRSNINFMIPENGNKKIILLTSSLSREGKTFCAINLAAIIAMSGKKTVILGLDLRKPKMHLSLELSNDQGISNFLATGENLEKYIVPTTVKNLSAIPSGPVPPNPSELLMGENFKLMISKLQEDFDYVIIDTPPIGLVTDAYLMEKISDLIVFVVRQGKTPKELVKNANELYVDGKLTNIGMILNDVKARGKYGYSYGYGYGYGYYDEEPRGIWQTILHRFGKV